MSSMKEVITKEQIEEIMERYGFNRTEMAVAAGVTEDAVRKWLDGKSNPNRSARENINRFIKKNPRRKQPA